MIPAILHLPRTSATSSSSRSSPAESAGAPVPGETALITGGVLAEHGQFHITA